MYHNNFLEEAVRIGDAILSQKIESSEGLFWKTMGYKRSSKIEWGISESIYSGMGGIILFFIELYKQTKQEKYLKAVVNGADGLLRYVKDNQTLNYAFFTGRIGVSFIFNKVYQLTGKKKYLTESINIALKCDNFFKHTDKVDDLISGKAGTLLGLLILHSEADERKLLPIINRYTEHLVNNIYHSTTGFYWNRETNHINGLCGFSHGASGVGFVFLQLGLYFNNPSFFWIAEQAFKYENQFFNSQIGNWPDFRNNIYDEANLDDFKQAYLSQNYAFFNKPTYMMAWCYGAPGIGLSRLYAWKLLKKTYLKRDIESSLNSTKMNTLSFLRESDTFTLCHGKGGNAMFFLEAYKCLQLKKAYYWAQQVAYQALDSKKNINFYKSGYLKATNEMEDTSLFMGNAGIGYFFLMCSDPNGVPPILGPRIEGRCRDDSFSSYEMLNISLPQLKKMIFSKSYPQTISLLEKRKKSPTERVFYLKESISEDFKTTFDNYIQKWKFDRKDKYLCALKNIYTMEKNKLEIDISLNPSYQSTKHMVLQKKNKDILSMSIKDFKKVKLIKNEDLFIYKNMGCYMTTDYVKYLDNEQENFEIPKDIIFFKVPLGIEEHSILPFNKKILNCFNKPKKVHEAIQILLQEYDLIGQKNSFETIILEQIKEYIRSLFLVESKSTL